MSLSRTEKNRLKSTYGPWAVVTGASSGIGFELAERLAESGLNLVINARHAGQLEQVKKRLQSQYGVEVRILAADVSEQAGTQAIIDQTRDLSIGLLVASAGFGTSGLFIESSLSDELDMLRLNCEGMLILTHHFSRLFAKNKRGGLILLSSMIGFHGIPYAAHYAATKAYVLSLGEALAVELRPVGVDVLVAAPGPVTSGFGKRANMQMNMSMKPDQVGIPILKALGRQSTVLPGRLTKFLFGSLMPLPRWGKIRIMAKIMGGMTAHQRT